MDFDEYYRQEREDAYRELFEDALQFSYVSDERTLNEAWLFFEEGWANDDADPISRDLSREYFYDLLGIDSSDIDWEAWRDLNGY